MFKDYVIAQLENEQLLIAENAKEIERCRNETKEMKEQIVKFRTQATTFQGTRCAHCQSQLDLPGTNIILLVTL